MNNLVAETVPQSVAIIAGNGELPLEIAHSLTEMGIGFVVIGIRGEAETAIEQFPHEWCEWEQIGRMYKLLENHRCKSVVLAGGVVGRPELRLSKLDWGAVRTLPGLLGALLEGDNTILTGIIGVFEKRGYTVLGLADLLPKLLVTRGANETFSIKTPDMKRIQEGAQVVSALGRFDIGQGCVVVGKRVVAIEGAEGTDAMLRRVREMREVGRLPDKKGGVLVKAPKPGQDERADLPAIGSQTIQSVFDAKLSGIGVLAGKTLILQKQETLALARRLKIFIHGFEEHDLHPRDG